MINGLCKPSLNYSLYYIPPHKPFIILCVTSLHTNHLHKPDNHMNHISFSILFPFTQSIPLHKPFIISFHTNQIICNTDNDKWFLWRDGLCEGINGLWKGWFVWREVLQRTINGLCDYLFCVKGCNTETDKGFMWMASFCGWFVWKPFIILCITSLHTNHPFTQTIYHSMYYIKSC